MGLGTASVKAQVRIGGNSAPNTAAALDLNATDAINNGTKGLALPRVSLSSNTAQLTSGVTNLTGMLVYNTNASMTGGSGVGIYYWNGSNWIYVSTGSFVEVDGVIGNEVLNATTGGGLVRAGSGTNADPYTLGINTGGVTSAMIADGTIATADIANNAVTVAKLPTGATATTFLRGDGTWVTPTNNTYTGSTSVTLNGSSFERAALTGPVTAAANSNATAIANNAITTAMVADGAITAAKLAAGAAFDGDSIVGNEVTNATANGGLVRAGSGTTAAPYTLGINTGGVTSAMILDGTIATADIANNAVTVAKLPTGATATTFLRGDGTWVTPTNNTYTGSTSITLNGTSFERAALTGPVTAAANSNATAIANNAITTAMVADGAITAAKLAAGAAFDGDSIVGNEVTNATASGGLVRAGSGTTAAPYTLGINTGGVTSAMILDGTIATADIANNAVTVAKLPTGATATTFLRGDGTWVTPTNNTYTGSTSITLNGTSFERAALTGPVTAAANSNTTAIANNAITTPMIADAAVTTGKIATVLADSAKFLFSDGSTTYFADLATGGTGATTSSISTSALSATWQRVMTFTVNYPDSRALTSFSIPVTGLQFKDLCLIAGGSGRWFVWPATNMFYMTTLGAIASSYVVFVCYRPSV